MCLIFALDHPRALISPSGPYRSHQLHSRQRALSWQEKQSVKLCLFFFFKIFYYQLLLNRVLLKKKTALQPTYLQLSPLQPSLFQQTSTNSGFIFHKFRATLRDSLEISSILNGPLFLKLLYLIHISSSCFLFLKSRDQSLPDSSSFSLDFPYQFR